jgi:hypothetical protein
VPSAVAEGSQVVARLDAGSQIRQGGEAELWFDTRTLHLFDPDTGRALAPGRIARGDGDGGPQVARGAEPAAEAAPPASEG